MINAIHILGVYLGAAAESVVQPEQQAQFIWIWHHLDTRHVIEQHRLSLDRLHGGHSPLVMLVRVNLSPRQCKCIRKSFA